MYRYVIVFNDTFYPLERDAPWTKDIYKARTFLTEDAAVEIANHKTGSKVIKIWIPKPYWI